MERKQRKKIKLTAAQATAYTSTNAEKASTHRMVVFKSSETKKIENIFVSRIGVKHEM